MQRIRTVGGGLAALVLLLSCGKPAPTPALADSAPPSSGAPIAIVAAGSTPLDSIALGSTLAEWRAGGFTDSLIVLDAGIQMQGDVQENLPLVQPLCAQATRVLRIEDQVVSRRRVLFDLVPPPGALPPRGASRAEVRDRFCRVVLVGIDASDTHQEAWRDEDIEAPFLDSLLRTVEPTLISDTLPTPRGQGMPTGFLGRTPDGVPVGWLVNHIYSAMDFSCFDGVTYEIAGPGWICYALYRWREGAPTGRPPVLVPLARHYSDPILGFLIQKLRLTDPALAREIEDHTLLPNNDAAFVDTTYVQFLKHLRGLADTAQGTRAAMLFAVLDAAIDQAMEARILGNPDRSTGPESTGEILRSLGADAEWGELGGYWVYDRPYLRRAELAGVRGELRDSLYSWLRRGESACVDDGGQNFAERIRGQRRYLDPSAPALSLEANSAMAQLWADSLPDSQGAEASTVVDSIGAALNRAYPLARDPAFKERIRTAIWLAAAGLPPLPRRQSCHIND